MKVRATRVKFRALAPKLFAIVEKINKNAFAILNKNEEKQLRLLLEKIDR